MLLFYRYQVNEDGTLTDNDTGRIMWANTRRGESKPYHLVKDDNGKVHFFSVKFLLDTLGVLEETPITERVNHTTHEVLNLDNLSSKERIDKIIESLL